MFKDLKRQKEANKEAAKRYRQKTKRGIIPPVIPEENIIPDVIPHSVFQYIMSKGGTITPTLLNALVDKGKRAKLQKLYDSLAKRGFEIYYGVSGITFKDIGELLDATQ